MKKILYVIMLLVGFLMLASESVSGSVMPNVIGLLLFVLSAYNLGLFTDRHTEP